VRRRGRLESLRIIHLPSLVCDSQLTDPHRRT
jgi:hypothetical protein